MRVDEVTEIFVYTGKSGDLSDGEIVNNIDQNEMWQRNQAQMRTGAGAGAGAVIILFLLLIHLSDSVGC